MLSRYLSLGFLLGFTLLPSLAAREYHVGKNGDNTRDGSAESPLLTIMEAARRALPGDTITVHAGIYREEIAPPRGGSSEDRRIVYQAAPGEDVEIRGSEVIDNWTRGDNGLWTTAVPNTLFGEFNPFADLVKGDWFTPMGRKHHTGCVYLDGEWLIEAASKKDLLNPPDERFKMAWYAEVGGKTTTIWANFNGRNPNDGLTEINVRQTVFYPRKPFVNYITVRGFKLRHAAPPWAPPTAEQLGLIGTHWSKGWIIENNVISHSINAGVSLGKYGDEFDNAAPTAQAYLDSIQRALNHGWNRQTVGSHVVRDNEIHSCEQVGIVGSMGACFSKITGNHIHHVYVQRRFAGAELAGIKFHAPIDVLIADNRIHDTGRGIWLDWMTQGTRVARNLCYRNDRIEVAENEAGNNNGNDMFLEVNHGPCVVDNNLFLSSFLRHRSQGTAFAHNLFAGEFDAWLDTGRQTPYFLPHSTTQAGVHAVDLADTVMFNNIFAGNGIDGSSPMARTLMKVTDGCLRVIGSGSWVFDEMPTPLNASGNIYYNQSKPSRHEKDAVTNGHDPQLEIIEKDAAVYLSINIDDSLQHAKTHLVTTRTMGKAIVPDLPYVDHDGSPISMSGDYFGMPRDPQHPSPGPFAHLKPGRHLIKVWPKQPGRSEPGEAAK